MAAKVKHMLELELRGRRVLIREDLNAPIAAGAVKSDTRLRAAIPTLSAALEQGAAVMVMSHLGRPKEGEYDAAFSLAPVAKRLSELLEREVPLQRNWLSGIDVAPGEIVLCENVRFEVGEKGNDPDLARKMAALCDLFVMDAFGTAHRAHASTAGVAELAPEACAGPLLTRELEALAGALEKPARPLTAIVGGAKVSSKLEVLRSLAAKVDTLILGGGIANTILCAAGHDVGRSLMEPDRVSFAAELLAGNFGAATVPLPTDVVVAGGLTPDAVGVTKSVEDVAADEMILDIGPRTAEAYAAHVKVSKTIVWNGPLGVFEHAEFSAGTRRIAEAVAASSAFSIAGGGDTLAAVEQFGISDQVSYISTGGGAFLEFLEGKELPAVAMLARRA